MDRGRRRGQSLKGADLYRLDGHECLILKKSPTTAVPPGKCGGREDELSFPSLGEVKSSLDQEHAYVAATAKEIADSRAAIGFSVIRADAYAGRLWNRPEHGDNLTFSHDNGEKPRTGHSGHFPAGLQVWDEITTPVAWTPNSTTIRVEDLDPSAIDQFLEDPKDPRLDCGAEVRTSGTTSLESRAFAAAADVANRRGLDTNAIRILAAIFEANGWSRARTIVEELLDRHASPPEVELAWQLRQLWQERSELWSDLRDLKEHMHLPWHLALDLLRAFGSLPSLAEVDGFLDEALRLWEDSRSHSSLLGFLRDVARRSCPERGRSPIGIASLMSGARSCETSVLGLTSGRKWRRLRELGVPPVRFPAPTHSLRPNWNAATKEWVWGGADTMKGGR